MAYSEVAKSYAANPLDYLSSQKLQTAGYERDKYLVNIIRADVAEAVKKLLNSASEIETPKLNVEILSKLNKVTSNVSTIILSLPKDNYDIY
jgi:hypothetical protein